MTVQTSYAEDFALGFKGLKAEPFSLSQVDSGLVEGAALGLAVAVKYGTAGDQYLAAAADDAVNGVSLFHGSHEKEADGSYSYAVGESFPVMKNGRVWMEAGAALAKGATVGYNPATGKVTAVAGGTTTLAIGKIMKASAADGDLVIVELDL